jgi:hypothetical protein
MADHPSRGVLPSVLCLSVIMETSRMRGPSPALGPQRHRKESRVAFDGLRSWFYDSLNRGIAEVKEMAAFCSCTV